MENYHWYILFVQGGREEKIITNIKLELEKEVNR
jgi:transcription antitermination factor NusG